MCSQRKEKIERDKAESRVWIKCFTTKRTMKGAVFIIVATIILGVWYDTPKTFLNRIDATKVMSISVFDGNTGKGFVVESSEEIRQIVENIQEIRMKRDNISVGYSGYSFRMQFMDKNGKVIDSFIINSSDTIRDDPFFYWCDGGLCYDYLKELEDVYAR